VIGCSAWRAASSSTSGTGTRHQYAISWAIGGRKGFGVGPCFGSMSLRRGAVAPAGRFLRPAGEQLISVDQLAEVGLLTSPHIDEHLFALQYYRWWRVLEEAVAED
jgi:hypothetical protein